jgi:hypothetical protein
MERLLADIIVAVHLAYVSYVIFGLLFIVVGVVLRWQWVRNPIFRWTHLLMICFVAGEALVDFECPLTTWEDYFLERIWTADVLPPATVGYVALLGSPLGGGHLLAAPVAAATRNPKTSDTFIGRCLDRMMFPPWPEWVFTPVYVGFALLVIATFVLAPPRRRRTRKSTADASTQSEQALLH